MADLSNMSYNVQSQSLSQVDTTVSTIKVTMDIESAQNKNTKNNMPIVANDRDIPIFLKDNDEELYHLDYKIDRSLKSR